MIAGIGLTTLIGALRRDWFPSLIGGLRFRFVAQDNDVGFWLLAKCDGKARPMTVIAGNNLQIAANLLYEPEDELHPKPFALGSLKSNR